MNCTSSLALYRSTVHHLREEHRGQCFTNHPDLHQPKCYVHPPCKATCLCSREFVILLAAVCREKTQHHNDCHLLCSKSILTSRNVDISIQHQNFYFNYKKPIKRTFSSIALQVDRRYACNRLMYNDLGYSFASYRHQVDIEDPANMTMTFA